MAPRPQHCLRLGHSAGEGPLCLVGVCYVRGPPGGLETPRAGQWPAGGPDLAEPMGPPQRGGVGPWGLVSRVPPPPPCPLVRSCPQPHPLPGDPQVGMECAQERGVWSPSPESVPGALGCGGGWGRQGCGGPLGSGPEAHVGSVGFWVLSETPGAAPGPAATFPEGGWGSSVLGAQVRTPHRSTVSLACLASCPPAARQLDHLKPHPLRLT